MAHQPHDRLFKRTFQNVENARGVFQTQLPKELSDSIDWESLRVEDGSFVDEELRSRQSDLLYSVTLNGEDAFLYLLFEHQSTRDPKMPLRILRYAVDIWERYLSVEAESVRLIPVIPLVLYHGGSRWDVPLNVVEMFDARAVAPALDAYLPRMPYLVDDLSELSGEEIRSRVELTNLARLCQAAFRILGHNPMPFLQGWLDVLKDTGLPILEGLLYYVWVRSDKAHRTEVARFMETHLGEKGARAVTTIADSYKAEGRAEGRAEALQEAILSALKARNVEADDASRRRIRECSDGGVLEGWMHRAFHVATVDELFSPKD